MAGRGRGRRILGFSVDLAGRGDSGPPAAQQPTPVFPVMEPKPLPLTGGEEAEYLLALKQDFRGAMRSLPCFIQPAAAHRDVERYSDKYHSGEPPDGLMDWTPDWKRFPRELRVQVRKEHRDRVCVSLSLSGGGQPAQRKTKKMKKDGEKEEVLLKLETLQKKEEQQSSEEEEVEKKKQEEEEAEAEEEYDEEEFEEETDYIMSYVSDGEDFGGDSDDNMDEAIY
ncbi:RNA polymerase III subunit GL b isoform X2 [Melanotaenia boesemani]|uniref:RNA polymerase III subunit GL b isoform X2 n=1 Tax=Melanotaenia boesemani TaxID=1250792 RepID=UPI001C04A34F|nr:RNA polymerase III subunit GL b isoform X2 [Melanotaenia boesemani]